MAGDAKEDAMDNDRMPETWRAWKNFNSEAANEVEVVLDLYTDDIKHVSKEVTGEEVRISGLDDPIQRMRRKRQQDGQYNDR
jgi:ribulose bisphosphate carboxylase small subunit